MSVLRRWVHRSFRALAALAVAGLSFGAGLAQSQDVQAIPALSARVLDQAGVLSPPDRAALESRLAAVERDKGSQIVVLTVPSTAPEDIAAFAQRVGDAWKLGRREVGDGLLIVVAVQDRRVNIQVAKALEGAIPDLAASRIIAAEITPRFRVGDYAGGLTAAVDRLAERIGQEGLPLPPAPEDSAWQPSMGSGGLDLESLAVFLFVAVPIAGSILTAMFGRRLGSLLTAGAAGGIGWWITASLLVAAGVGLAALVLVGLFGVGAARRAGGRGRSGAPIVWGGGHHGGGWSSGGGGGGFSSGGGGDFGGGGASGSW